MSIRLLATPGTTGVRSPLIAGNLAKMEVALVPFDSAVEGKKAAFIDGNRTRTVPCLETPEGYVFGVGAMARHLARTGAPALLGASPWEHSLVEQWECFASTELEMPVAVLVGEHPTKGAFQPSALAQAQAAKDLTALLTILDSELANKKTFLVGSAVTLADLAVATTLFPAATANPAIFGKLKNAKHWFDSFCKLPEAAPVLAMRLTISEAFLAAQKMTPPALQKAINMRALALEELKERKGSKEEVAAASDEVEDMRLAMVAMLPLGDGDRKKKGKAEYTKKKEKKKLQNKKKAKEAPPASKEMEFTETTALGEKKVLIDMPDTYYANYVESAWYEWWDKSGYFQPIPPSEGERTFVIVIPPPNVTGNLHLGHALTNSIQDCIVRWHRMKGEAVLWVPGTDHAGIATQVVVEKKIMKTEGKTRHQYGREKFIEKVWEWKEEYGKNITTQLRRLGSSTDWSREVFTMDDKLNVAVREAFVRMHADGLIYRSNRLVNWSCTLKTAISDIEVAYLTLDEPTWLKVPGHGEKEYLFGTLISFAYPIADSPDEEIVVATTRLETMLADTAVAIHPRDPRYTHLHGKSVRHPINGRIIPIVLDDELVDMSFGTGAVKVTPAHDPNDYIVGKKHNLEFITLLEDEGDINENGGKYKGWKRFDARVGVCEELKKLGLYRGTVANPGMRLGLCERSKDIVEPFLRAQWFCDCKGMAKASTDAVRSGELKIIPESHNNVWFNWLDNIQDWCISRQLWWGHRIPAYYVTFKGEDRSSIEDEDRWVVGRDEAEARANAAKKFKKKAKDILLEQDPDVLDTWFSSGLFPFSVMGWPEETEDMRRFYPTSLLETGHDIIFFWVARMVMMGLQLTGKLPFKEIYLHAMVRDAHGRKMSKSKGNVVNPLNVIEGITLEGLKDSLKGSNLPDHELETAHAGQENDFPHGFPRCGADALRFGLLAYTSQGRDINLDVDVIIGWRNFCNKIWQMVKFTLNTFGPDFKPEEVAEEDRSVADRWILASCNVACGTVDTALGEYDFSTSTGAAYTFVYNQLCGYYLELIKPVAQSGSAKEKKTTFNTLYTVVERALRMLSPFMPFITEELWQRLPRREGDVESITIAAFPMPVPAWDDAALLVSFEDTYQATLKAARSMRSQYNLVPKQTCVLIVDCRTEESFKDVQKYAAYIKTLANAEDIKVELQLAEPPQHCAPLVVNADITMFIYLKGIVDPAKEIKKLEKTKLQLEKKVAALSRTLNDQKYLSKAPPAQQEKDKKTLVEVEATLRLTIANLESFKAM